MNKQISAPPRQVGTIHISDSGSSWGTTCTCLNQHSHLCPQEAACAINPNRNKLSAYQRWFCPRPFALVDSFQNLRNSLHNPVV